MEIVQIKSKFLNGAFDQNTYVCLEKDEAIIVDAGADTDDVKRAVGKRRVLAVLLTHLHFDHLWCIEEYDKKFDCDIYVFPGAEDRLLDAEKNASFLIGKDMTFKPRASHIKHYREGTLELGEFVVEVIFSPGHTSDSVCLKLGDALFSGDTVFADSFGRTDLFSGNGEELFRSLKRIADTDFSVCYPGHFEPASKAEILNLIEWNI